MIATEIIGHAIQALAQYEWIGLWFTGIFCLIPVIFIIIWLLVSYWVYKDAESRGMNGALWFIVVFLLGIVGLIIYVVVRSGEKGKREEIKRICPHCGRVVKEDVKFCPHCGKELE